MNSNKDDTFFKKEFSKRLAEALLNNDDGQLQQQGGSSISDLRHLQAMEAYRQLCYDDPILQSDRDCFLLGEALMAHFTDLDMTQEEYISTSPSTLHPSSTLPTLPTRFRLGLSDRLVEGIVQVTCNKYDHRRNAVTSHGSDDDDTHDKDTTSLIQRTKAESGYVHLAFTIFGQGLGYCCSEIIHAIQSWDDSHTDTKPFHLAIPQCRAFLGSFTGKQDTYNTGTDAIKPYHHNKDDDESSIAILHDDLIEVFAEESDSDDFDYTQKPTNNTLLTSNVDPSIHDVTLSQIQEGFDPLILSQPHSFPSPLESSIDCLHKLYLLIPRLSYTMVAPLSTQQWNDLKVSQILSDLILDLLFLFCLETSTTTNTVNYDITPHHDAIPRRSIPKDVIDKMQMLGSTFVCAIQVLRDRSLDQTQQFHSMDDYVHLLLKLILQEKSMEIQSIGFSLFLDFVLSFQRNKLLDRLSARNISIAFTKKQLILRNAILSTFHPLQKTICTMRFQRFASSSSDHTFIIHDDQSWIQYVLEQSLFAFLFINVNREGLFVQQPQQQTTNDTWDIEIERYTQGKEILNLEGRNKDTDNPNDNMARILAHQAVKYILQKLDYDKPIHAIPTTTLIPSNLNRRSNFTSKRD